MPSSPIPDALPDRDSVDRPERGGEGRSARKVVPRRALAEWDPDGRGDICSGQQLFGSVSWWLFFRNGYEALDALDDNRDGSLAGTELKGIAAWFDADSDGRSDPGEVTPVERLGVVALSTQVTSYDGDSPMSDRGVTMADGRVGAF